MNLKAVHDTASAQPNHFKVEGLKEAKAAAHKIEWVKGPNDKNRDQKTILVDNVPWAWTWTSHHGMHGKSYTFHQIGGELIQREDKNTREESRYRFREVKIRSSNARRIRNGIETDMRPTEDRIIDEARKLIAERLLIHPDEQAALVAARRKASAERAAEQEAEAKEKLRKKAREAIGPIIHHLPTGLADEVINDIVAAMEWAQTQ